MGPTTPTPKVSEYVALRERSDRVGTDVNRAPHRREAPEQLVALLIN
jgi:hypothetical protein